MTALLAFPFLTLLRLLARVSGKNARLSDARYIAYYVALLLPALIIVPTYMYVVRTKSLSHRLFVTLFTAIGLIQLILQPTLRTATLLYCMPTFVSAQLTNLAPGWVILVLAVFVYGYHCALMDVSGLAHALGGRIDAYAELYDAVVASSAPIVVSHFLFLYQWRQALQEADRRTRLMATVCDAGEQLVGRYRTREAETILCEGYERERQHSTEGSVLKDFSRMVRMMDRIRRFIPEYVVGEVGHHVVALRQHGDDDDLDTVVSEIGVHEEDFKRVAPAVVPGSSTVPPAVALNQSGRTPRSGIVSERQCPYIAICRVTLAFESRRPDDAVRQLANLVACYRPAPHATWWVGAEMTCAWLPAGGTGHEEGGEGNASRCCTTAACDLALRVSEFANVDVAASDVAAMVCCVATGPATIVLRDDNICRINSPLAFDTLAALRDVAEELWRSMASTSPQLARFVLPVCDATVLRDAASAFVIIGIGYGLRMERSPLTPPPPRHGSVYVEGAAGGGKAQQQAALVGAFQLLIRRSSVEGDPARYELAADISTRALCLHMQGNTREALALLETLAPRQRSPSVERLRFKLFSEFHSL